MKPLERDELLFRLDERTRNIWTCVEKIERHAEVQNGHIFNITQSSQRNTIFRKWAERLVIPLVAFIVGWLAKLQGWIL